MKRFMACLALLLLCASTIVAQQPPEPSLDGLLREKIAGSLGPEAARDELSAWVGKDGLRRKLEFSLGSSGFGLGLSIPHRNVPAPKPAVLKTPPPKDFPCNPPMGCPSDCDKDCERDVFGGKIVDPICYAGCSAWKGTCELANATWKASCEVAKATYLGVMDKKLGEIAFDDTSLEGDLVLSNFRLEIDPELRTARLSGNLSGRGRVQGRMSMKPEPVLQLGLLCYAYDGWVPPTDVQVQATDITLTARLTFEPVDASERELKVLLAIDPIDVKFTILGNPFINIVANNPANFFQCALPTMATIVVDLFEGEYTFDSPMTVPALEPIVLSRIRVDNELFAALTGTKTTEKSIGLVAEGGVQP
jgi:hypothetical protein